MTQYVYMNERISQKRPRKPVIVCQHDLADSPGSLRSYSTEANEFELRVGGVLIGRVKYDRAGLEACKTHEVKAWVELMENVDVVAVGDEYLGPVPVVSGTPGIQVLPVSQPASAKKPNSKVQF